MFAFIEGIIIFITTITLPISGLFVHLKPAANPIVTPTPTISTSISPTPKKLSPTPIKQIIKNESSYQYNSVPNSPTQNSEPQNPGLKTYPVVPIGDLSSLSSERRQQMIEIYNEFLKTPNLRYLTPQQQEEIFKQKANTYLDNYKRQLLQEERQLQENVNQLKQQLNQIPPTSTTFPAPFQPDPEIVAKLDELRQTLAAEQGRPVPQNVMEGRKQVAYQKWMQDNFGVYTAISGNSYYTNMLNSIRRAYGI